MLAKVYLGPLLVSVERQGEVVNGQVVVIVKILAGGLLILLGQSLNSNGLSLSYGKNLVVR